MISKEDMRVARLRALDCPSSRTETHVHDAEATSSDSKEHLEKRRHITDERSIPLPFDTLKSLIQRMHENGGATDEDILRWYNQGFQFCETPSFGLRQGNGGPCGVLAAVQAEILKFAIFGNSPDSSGVLSLPLPSESDVQRIFASACGSILARAAEGKISTDYFICIADCPGLGLSPSSAHTDIIVHNFTSESDANRFILERLDLFKSRIGCMLFLMSLMLSRGLDRIILDMDIETNTLIGLHGHCSQELLNLLLTGVASSNIMDGVMSMNGMTVKGVCQRSSIGYLTHLESLRYCQAGYFYKVPTYPIWVVGSTAHFSVLFALDRRVNEETESEKLLSLAQRAFKSADPEENGFIDAEKLKQVLEVLQYDEVVDNDIELARLRGHLQIDGGIILWSSFWENVSQLISKRTTLDSMINISLANIAGLNQMIPALVDGAANESSGWQRERSDSDVAREMQAEMDESVLLDTSNPSKEDGIHSESKNIEGNRMRSDSEVARELQAKWNSEEFDPSDTAAITSSENLDTLSSMSTLPFLSNRASSAPISSSPSIRSHLHRHDSFAGEDAAQHLLYHFNGLESAGRLACLTSFKLMPRSSENAIGVSVALGGQSDNGPGGFSNPIEEVLRTRWPGCRIDWMGHGVPSID